jgi:hypothetical protein
VLLELCVSQLGQLSLAYGGTDKKGWRSPRLFVTHIFLVRLEAWGGR